MAMMRYVWICVLVLAMLPGWAQHEIEVDWAVYAQDTVMPVFVYNVDLGYDYADEYKVAIEYPELKPLTAEEVIHYRLPEEAGLPEWPVVDVYKGISAKRGQLDISFIPIIWRDGQYQKMVNFTLKVSAMAGDESLAVGIQRVQSEGVSDSRLQSGRWVKLRVSDNGIHMITHARLKSMGFNAPEKVRLYGYGGHILSESDIDSWIDDLCEVPLCREDDRLLFYAYGTVRWSLQDDNTFTHTNNPYSEHGYYFLTEGEPVASSSFEGNSHAAYNEGDKPITTTPAYALHEVDDYAWFHGGRQLVESYDYSAGNVKRYALSAPQASTHVKGTLDVCFTHNGSTTTSVSIATDSATLGTFTINPVGRHSEAASATRSYAMSLIQKDGDAKQYVKLTHNRGAGVSGRLDFLRLNYTRTIGLGHPIYATSMGTHTYEVKTSGEDVVVWRITDAAAIEEIPFDKAKRTFTTTGRRGDVYIAFDTKSTYPMPEEVGEIANQNLHATESTDYVIIVPSNDKLTTQAERLAEAHRLRRGLRVKVVRADEVYNEFSSGTPDATAYRRYLKMLYDRAETMDDAPKYLLLFGDGAWDNRMLSAAWKGKSPDDYLLCFEAVNSFSAISSYVMEDYFGLLDDGEGSRLLYDKVDVGVGRFPVTTVTQAREAVDKVIAYMDNAEAGAWKNTILMLGDDGDNNQHMRDAEQIAGMLESTYPDYMVKRIYWDAYPMEVTATGHSYPTIRKRLLELFDEGALMVNYSGHGAPDVLSHELVINRTDMEQLRSPRLPVWVTVSCDITPFDNTSMSFGECAFLNPKGGAIALMTSTRTTFSDQNRRINYFFSKYLFSRDENNCRLSLGDAMRMAKCNLITTTTPSLQDMSENKLNYALIGDPALIIGNAEYTMVVDEINDVAVDAHQEIVLKAGSRVSVKGHVSTLNGRVATDFQGVMYATVSDNIEQVTCRNNAGTASTPFTYRERTKTLFMGGDSVRAGEFSFTFRVPMDINYSMKNGLINLYAINDAHELEAKGMYDDFLLGGTESLLVNDSLGPKVELYLNSPDFITGDQVNETPHLMVMLEDPDGINTVGNGIGHDLIAIIDGEAAQTYNLNDYYTSQMGDYTRGTITYNIPELSEGMHTLMFRAWDMMNNATTVTVDFEVVKGLRPRILDITTTHSPAREYTTFVLTHDRPETEVTVRLEVFDLSGRMLWMHTEQAVTPDNIYSIDWGLCASSGQPLASGVYLYRATVTSASGKSTSKARKLTILR